MSARRAASMLLKVNPNQAPPIVGVTDANVNRPFITRRVAPALRTIGQVQSGARSTTTACSLKFQRRFANNFSFMNSYTFGQSMDFNSDNDGDVTLTNVYDIEYNRGLSDYDVSHTFSTNAGSTSSHGRATSGTAAGSSSGILLPARRRAADDHADPGRAVDGNRQPAQPRVRRPAGQPDDRPAGSTRRASCRRPDITGTYGDSGRGILRGPGSFNIDTSNLIKNTKIGRFNTEIRIEAFNVLNHPQFCEPEHARSTTRPAARSRRCWPARTARSAARPSGRFRSA